MKGFVMNVSLPIAPGGVLAAEDGGLSKMRLTSASLVSLWL
jgi:hypothetical protein